MDIVRLIDADAVIDTLRYQTDFEHEQGKPEMLFKIDALEKVKALPTIDPVKHGAWVKGSCSICGEDALLDDVENEFLSKYCPFCGARMDGGTEDDG